MPAFSTKPMSLGEAQQSVRSSRVNRFLFGPGKRPQAHITSRGRAALRGSILENLPDDFPQVYEALMTLENDSPQGTPPSDFWAITGGRSPVGVVNFLLQERLITLNGRRS